jgi:hypothetical protein
MDEAPQRTGAQRNVVRDYDGKERAERTPILPSLCMSQFSFLGFLSDIVHVFQISLSEILPAIEILPGK